MDEKQRITLIFLCLLGAAYFGLFIPANDTGAKDPVMISLFEPDEFAQYSIPRNMLAQQDTFKHSIYNFIAYDHYYYGFPFYLYSAVTLIPLKISSGITNQNSQLTMLILRQMVSVLPMIMAILLVIYLQTRFKSLFQSLAIFIFLISVPAVVENNLWWHPDSLVVFFIVLTLLLLVIDNNKFGRFFLAAAISCGLAVGTKVLGFFFFLTIPVYLGIGIYTGHLNWRKTFIKAGEFLLIMNATIIISNPYLLIPSQFNQMIQIMTRQSSSMSSGWTLFYDKGPASWVGILSSLYGSIPFLVMSLVLLILTIRDRAKRLSGVMILTWIAPLSIYILFFVAIKPTHFFLPVIIPLFSILVTGIEYFKPDSIRRIFQKTRPFWGKLLLVSMGGLIIFQFAQNISTDVRLYSNVLNREKTNLSIQFYENLSNKYLDRIPSSVQIKILRDVRAYFPSSGEHKVSEFYNTLTYATLMKKSPDILVLWRQRIADYTQSGVTSTAVNQETFKEIYRFFLDAKDYQIDGYRLLYQNDSSIAFIAVALDDTYHLTNVNPP